MSSKKLNPFKDFQSDQIQRSSRKIFTAHYACRNAALNLTPVTGTTNGFIFQIINSLIESWGVRFTCFDCKFRGSNDDRNGIYSSPKEVISSAISFANPLHGTLAKNARASHTTWHKLC